MRSLKLIQLFSLLFFTPVIQISAKEVADTLKFLDQKQQALVEISSYAAMGKLEHLASAIHKGLDTGLDVNKIKEGLIHLYAYAGFPRSIRGLQTLMAVVDERKAKGINDEIGSTASPIKDDNTKYDRGKHILSQLTGVPQSNPLTGYSAFAPVIDTFLKEHLFADIFERDILSYTERELVTVSVLSSIGDVEPMLRSHLKICLNLGVTEDQLQEFLRIIRATAGRKEAKAAQIVLNEVLNSKS